MPASHKTPAVEFRRGLMIAGLEASIAALYLAYRSIDLLESADRERLKTAMELLQGIEQRAWSKASP